MAPRLAPSLHGTLAPYTAFALASSSSVPQVMPGPRFALVYLAVTLSTVDGWGMPSDNKTSPLSSNESAITGEADGARAWRQLQGCNGGCDASCDVCDSYCNTCDSSCDGSCDLCCNL